MEEKDLEKMQKDLAKMQKGSDINMHEIKMVCLDPKTHAIDYQ